MTAGRAVHGATPAGPAQLRAGAGRRGSRRPNNRSGRRRLRRRRLAGLLRFVVFLLLIFVAVWAGVRVAHAGTDADVYTGHTYVVSSGDTLWGIAGREYGSDVDLRRAIYRIREVNRLETSTVSPGDRLTLPYIEE
ncbi:MAG: LysM peptidoglycan-binding domain-containing protein [Actinobacteria bacterium]|nr:LysM peptidoglycan-binding domain-containing protein [Actinomycetota bacterium]